MNPFEVVAFIGAIIRDPRMDKKQLKAMEAFANDFYAENFAGKRPKEELCAFVATMILLLGENLADLQEGAPNVEYGSPN